MSVIIWEREKQKSFWMKTKTINNNDPLANVPLLFAHEYAFSIRTDACMLSQTLSTGLKRRMTVHEELCACANQFSIIEQQGFASSCANQISFSLSVHARATDESKQAAKECFQERRRRERGQRSVESFLSRSEEISDTIGGKNAHWRTCNNVISARRAHASHLPFTPEMKTFSFDSTDGTCFDLAVPILEWTGTLPAFSSSTSSF